MRFPALVINNVVWFMLWFYVQESRSSIRPCFCELYCIWLKVVGAGESFIFCPTNVFAKLDLFHLDFHSIYQPG